MGQENVSAFKDSPELLFDSVGDYDMVVVCAQECRKKFKHEKLRELEAYM